MSLADANRAVEGGAAANDDGAEGGAPPALDPARDALFLDFDGTLAELVDHPDEARLPESARAALEALGARFSGAVAVISGRSAADLDARLPTTLWRAGGHGAEIYPAGRPADGSPSPRVEALAAALRPVADAHEGVLIEPKTHGAALHFRQAPQAEADCRAAMARTVARMGGFVVQDGKMVVEARPVSVDKGAALAALMELRPFAGRRPVMAGDDLTDEAAMRAAVALGGIAVKVGSGDSAARFRLTDPAAVRAWLGLDAD